MLSITLHRNLYYENLLKKMKIFITGIAGFLGSHLSRIYASNENKIGGCDNLAGGYVDNIDDSVDFHQVDCIYLNSINNTIQNNSVALNGRGIHISKSSNNISTMPWILIPGL